MGISSPSSAPSRSPESPRGGSSAMQGIYNNL